MGDLVTDTLEALAQVGHKTVGPCEVGLLP